MIRPSEVGAVRQPTAKPKSTIRLAQERTRLLGDKRLTNVQKHPLWYFPTGLLFLLPLSGCGFCICIAMDQAVGPINANDSTISGSFLDPNSLYNSPRLMLLECEMCDPCGRLRVIN